MKTGLLSFLLLAIFCTATAQNNDSFESLVRLGIQLHDQEDYENAIKTYEQALEVRPKSKLALYEMAYTYSMMKNYEKSIECAQQALASSEEDTKLDLSIYMAMGSAYDDMGQPQQALKIYTQALDQGEHYLLYFNKGLTHHRINEIEDALLCYKNALMLKVTHPASNLNVARIYLERADVASAFFYYIYFLMIEPYSARSQVALEELFSIGKGNNIVLPSEGETMLPLIISTGFMGMNALAAEPGITMTPYDKLLKVFQAVYSLKDKVDVKQLKDDICSAYYAPLFYAACDNGYMEILCRYVTCSIDEKSDEWLQENKEEVDKFFIWVNAFGDDKEEEG